MLSIGSLQVRVLPLRSRVPVRTCSQSSGVHQRRIATIFRGIPYQDPVVRESVRQRERVGQDHHRLRGLLLSLTLTCSRHRQVAREATRKNGPPRPPSRRVRERNDDDPRRHTLLPPPPPRIVFFPVFSVIVSYFALLDSRAFNDP